MINEGIYNIYISKSRDMLLLSNKKNDKAFIVKNIIFLMLIPNYKVNRESLAYLCEKTAINAVAFEKEDETYEVKGEMFPKETVFKQNLDYINYPQTYIFANIFKSTGIVDALERLVNDKCVIPAAIKDAKHIQVYSVDDKVIAFTNSAEAQEYIDNNELTDLKPMTCYVGKCRRHTDLYFPNDDILILRKKDGGY